MQRAFGRGDAAAGCHKTGGAFHFFSCNRGSSRISESLSFPLLFATCSTQLKVLRVIWSLLRLYLLFEVE